MNHLGMGYLLNPQTRILVRPGLDKKMDLMWKYGGVPTFNSIIYDKGGFDWIGIKFKDSDEKWITSKKLFDDNKKAYQNGGETKYYCDKFFWTIINSPVDKQR